MNALFFHCMRWSCFETVTFNVLLAAHTSLLFLVMPLSAYGIFGTTVALSYAIASFATIGNDVITGLLLTATPSYTSLRSTLCAHVLQAAVVGIVSCLCIYLFTATCWNTYNVTLRVLGISLAITETMRKILKSMLLAMYHFKPVVHIEVGALIIYMCVIWCLFGLGYTLTSALLIGLLCISSLIVVAIFSFNVYQIYVQLPCGIATSLWGICHVKIRTSLSGIVHLIFSPNTLIPLTAFLSGSIQAGSMKLVATVFQYVTTIIERTFCVPSSLFFAHATDQHDTHHFVRLAYRYLLPWLAIGTCSAALLIYSIAWYTHTMFAFSLVSIIYVCMQILGVITDIIERFLCVHNERYIIHLYVITICISTLLLFYSASIGYQYVFFAFAIIRLCFLCAVAYLYILHTASTPIFFARQKQKTRTTLSQKKQIHHQPYH
jgi:hypothetical protein